MCATLRVRALVHPNADVLMLLPLQFVAVM